MIRLSDKSDKLTFRCAEELKQTVAKTAIDRKMSIENLCVVLIAEGLGLKVKDDTGDASAAA